MPRPYEALGDVPCETRHEVLPHTPRSVVTPAVTPRGVQDFLNEDSQLRPEGHQVVSTHSSQPRLDEVLREQAGELENCLNTFLNSQKTLAGKLSSQQEHLIRLLEDLPPGLADTRLADDQSAFPSSSSMAVEGHDVDASHQAQKERRSVEFLVIDTSEQLEVQDGDPHDSKECDRDCRVESSDATPELGTEEIPRVASDPRASTMWHHMLKPSNSVFSLSSRYDFTKSVLYEVSMMFVIMLNAAYIGWSVQHALKSRDNQDEPYYGPFIFLSIYLFDLGARLFFERMRFFRGRERYWNLFDSFVVLVMIIELVLGLHFEDADYKERHDLAVLRVFRVLRLFRFVKVVQYFFEFSREFRMLVYSSQKAVRAFFWMIILLGFMVYFVAIVMTQGALGTCHARALAETDPVCERFGSLDRAVLNLYLAVFGGIMWGELEAAAEALGLMFALVIIFFVSFMHIILLNAITGVVLDIHGNISETEKLTMIEDTLQRKQDYVLKMQDVFEEIDINSSGGISIDEFQMAVEDERVCALLEKLDVEVKDAHQLFGMLDRDGTGAIEIDEFIFGLMHMKGDAKAIDILKLQIESEWLMKNINVIRKSLDKLCDNPPAPTSPAFKPAASSSRKATGTSHQINSQGSISSTLILTTPSWRSPPLIESTEERALTLSDLEGIITKIRQECIQESWKDMRTLKRLRPQDVNLYHFNWHCICPTTAPEGVELRGLNLSIPVMAGQKVVQMDAVNHVCLAEGILFGDATKGVLSVHLTKGRFQALDEAADSCVSIEGISVGTPEEITAKMSFSYKEMINPTPTKAVWFCSHWWGEPVADFVECCAAHSRLRHMSAKHAPYWVCAYANRQHDIQDDICCDPDASAFRRAMRAAEGVLLVLDSMATPFGRIWCDFELYHTLSDEKPLDIVTIAGQGSKRSPQLLSQTNLPGETVFTKARREGGFPIDLLVSGMHARLEEGAASHPSDKPRILRCMARKQTRTSGVNISESKADLEVALERANGMLHSYLALAAWPQAVKKACVSDFDPQNPGTLCLPDVLARASHLQHFNLSLAHVKELRDADLELLSRSFPDTLCRIHLCFEGCANITDAGLTSLVEALPSNLHELSLDCVGCHRISDTGLRALARNLPAGLRKLDLFFATCPLIGMDGITALVEGFPGGLKHFRGRFEGTQVNRKFDSAKEMTKFVRSPGSRSLRGAAQALRASISNGH